MSQGRRPFNLQTCTSEAAAASRCWHAVASTTSGPAENFSFTTAFAPDKSSQAAHFVPGLRARVVRPQSRSFTGRGPLTVDAEQGAPSWGTILVSIERKNTQPHGAAGQTMNSLTWGAVSGSSLHISSVWLRNIMDGVVRYNAVPRQSAI